jgi:2'-5' RNA ligase
LKFLGEVEPAQTDLLRSRLQEVTSAQNPFSLALGQLGCFPNRYTPRVLWIGITEGAEQLATLSKLIDAACAQLGFAAAEQPFRPHLTIARAGSNSCPAFNPEPNVIFQNRCLVSSYALVESKLLRTGAQYKIIDDFGFGKPEHD